MSCALIRISVLASAALMLSGCGGSSGNGGGNGGGGNNPTTVTFTITEGIPTAVATQIGSGSFTAVTPAGTITLTLPSGTTKFAVAYVCPAVTTGETATTYQQVFAASTLDGTSFSETCLSPATGGATGTLIGAVDASAINGTYSTAVSASNGSQSEEDFLIGDASNISEALPVGSSDRVAVAAYSSASTEQFGANSNYTLLAVRNFPSQAVPGALNSGNTVVLGNADQVTMQPITYQNASAGFSAPTTSGEYFWNGNGNLLLSLFLTSQYPAVPQAAAESGDSYLFQSDSSFITNSGLASVVGVTTKTTSSGSLTVSFPASWGYAGPTPAAIPTFSLSYTGFAGSSNVVSQISVSSFVNANTESYYIYAATRNFLGEATTLTLPDLASLPGFLAHPASGSLQIWEASVSKLSSGVFEMGSSSGTAASVATSGFYTVP